MSRASDCTQPPAVSLADAHTAAAFATLQQMVDRLFAACPWWRIQTHASLTPYVLEEAREVAAALAPLCAVPAPASAQPVTLTLEQSLHLAAELGDLLLQVLTQAKLAEMEGLFTLADVLERLSAKLARRHPHVFAAARASTPEAVDVLYMSVKAQERTLP